MRLALEYYALAVGIECRAGWVSEREDGSYTQAQEPVGGVAVDMLGEDDAHDAIRDGGA